MKVITILLILALLLLNACGKTALDDSSEKQQIKKNFENWLKGVERGDVDDYFNYITDDFIFLGPGAKPVDDPDSLRAFLDRFLSANDFTMPQWTSEEIEIRDDLAIHRYSAVAYIKPKSGTGVVESDRKYLDVLKKNENGQWKVYLHSFNSNK